MTSRPTNLPTVTLAEIAGLMIRAYENHWLPLMRPAFKPLFPTGVTTGEDRLTSHSNACGLTNPKKKPPERWDVKPLWPGCQWQNES